MGRGVSNETVRDEIEKDLVISDITATDLQDEIIAAVIDKKYREQVTKRKEISDYKPILSIYVGSLVQDFERLLRKEIDLVKDDSRLALN